MNNPQDGQPKDFRQTIWVKLFMFAVTIVMMYDLAFNIIPGLIKHDIHKLPDGFFYLSIMIISFMHWYVWGIGEILVKILITISAISMLAYIVSGIILEGIKFRGLPPFIITVAVFGPIILGIIRTRKSHKMIDDQESRQDL